MLLSCYGDSFPEKARVLILAPTGVASNYVSGTTVYSALVLLCLKVIIGCWMHWTSTC